MLDNSNTITTNKLRHILRGRIEALRYDPRVLILDLGGSYRWLTRFLGGRYLELSPGEAEPTLRLQPFALPAGTRTFQFLTGWVLRLLKLGGWEASGADTSEIRARIEDLYAFEPERRTLSVLASSLPSATWPAWSRWIEGGAWGAYFDNPAGGAPDLEFADWQVIDLAGAVEHPDLCDAALSYLLERMRLEVEDPSEAARLKLMVVDEAWRYLQDPAVLNYLAEAAKTWRKKNAALVLATQSAVDVTATPKLFLANPELPDAVGALFRLNGSELAQVRGLIPKRELYLRRPDGVTSSGQRGIGDRSAVVNVSFELRLDPCPQHLLVSLHVEIAGNEHPSHHLLEIKRHAKAIIHDDLQLSLVPGCRQIGPMFPVTAYNQRAKDGAGSDTLRHSVAENRNDPSEWASKIPDNTPVRAHIQSSHLFQPGARRGIGHDNCMVSRAGLVEHGLSRDGQLLHAIIGTATVSVPDNEPFAIPFRRIRVLSRAEETDATQVIENLAFGPVQPGSPLPIGSNHRAQSSRWPDRKIGHHLEWAKRTLSEHHKELRSLPPDIAR